MNVFRRFRDIFHPDMTERLAEIMASEDPPDFGVAQALTMDRRIEDVRLMVAIHNRIDTPGGRGRITMDHASSITYRIGYLYGYRQGASLLIPLLSLVMAFAAAFFILLVMYVNSYRL